MEKVYVWVVRKKVKETMRHVQFNPTHIRGAHTLYRAYRIGYVNVSLLERTVHQASQCVYV